MSNMTDLWLSGEFFQALNTPKLVFGPFPPQRFSISISAPRLSGPPTQIPGYAYGQHAAWLFQTTLYDRLLLGNSWASFYRITHTKLIATLPNFNARFNKRTGVNMPHNMYNASCQYVYTGCLQFLNSCHEQFINPIPNHFTFIIKLGVCCWSKKRSFSVQLWFHKINCGFSFFGSILSK